MLFLTRMLRDRIEDIESVWGDGRINTHYTLVEISLLPLNTVFGTLCMRISCNNDTTPHMVFTRKERTLVEDFPQQING